MKGSRGEMLLPISLGLADGILNALTLASASLVGSSAHVTVGLALRICLAALVTAGFAVYVATYSEARGALRRASHQLSLSAEDGLVATQLGRNAVRRASEHSGLAAASSMLGALLPLLIAAALPGPGWIAAVIAIAALGLLGIGLATAVLGSRVRWGITLAIGGAAVTAIGAWIHIAG
jgi:hypothetical protein